MSEESMVFVYDMEEYVPTGRVAQLKGQPDKDRPGLLIEIRPKNADPEESVYNKWVRSDYLYVVKNLEDVINNTEEEEEQE
jgi:hypothetical protein